MNKVMEKTRVTTPESKSLVHQGWPPFEGLRNEIDRLFRSYEPGRLPSFGWGHLWEPQLPWQPMTERLTAPPIDVVRTETGYEVNVDLPGMSEKDVEVSYADGMLTISGEKTEESGQEKTGVLVSERRYGSFRRSLRVPETVDPAKIEGHVEKGVLTVVLPIRPEMKSSERKIEVKSR